MLAPMPEAEPLEAALDSPITGGLFGSSTGSGTPGSTPKSLAGSTDEGGVGHQDKRARTMAPKKKRFFEEEEGGHNTSNPDFKASWAGQSLKMAQTMAQNVMASCAIM